MKDPTGWRWHRRVRRPIEISRALDLAAELEAMGPTFIKLGQLLSTRVDLLPPATPRS